MVEALHRVWRLHIQSRIWVHNLHLIRHRTFSAFLMCATFSLSLSLSLCYNWYLVVVVAVLFSDAIVIDSFNLFSDYSILRWIFERIIPRSIHDLHIITIDRRTEIRSDDANIFMMCIHFSCVWIHWISFVPFQRHSQYCQSDFNQPNDRTLSTNWIVYGTCDDNNNNDIINNRRDTFVLRAKIFWASKYPFFHWKLFSASTSTVKYLLEY